MEISDYIKELDRYKDYLLSVRIPYLKQYHFQEVVHKHNLNPITYSSKYWPSLGKSFTCWIFFDQIPSYSNFKNGKDMTHFGIQIQ